MLKYVKLCTVDQLLLGWIDHIFVTPLCTVIWILIDNKDSPIFGIEYNSKILTEWTSRKVRNTVKHEMKFKEHTFYNQETQSDSNQPKFYEAYESHKIT